MTAVAAFADSTLSRPSYRSGLERPLTRRSRPLRDARPLIMRAMRAALGGFAIGLLVTPATAADFSLAADRRAVGAVDYGTTQRDDTLLDLARRYDLGFTQLMAANRGIDPWLPGTGRRITVPAFYLLPDAPQEGIVVNLAEQRLF